MGKRRFLREWSESSADPKVVMTASSAIVAVTGAFLAVGAVALYAWRLSGNDLWVTAFFQRPGALLMATLAAAELVFSIHAVREFSHGQPLRTAWQFIAISAGCNFCGVLLVHVSHVDWVAFRNVGFILGGSFRYILLTAGLFWTLKVYRKVGLLGRLATIDWILLGGVAMFVIRELRDVVVAMHHGKHPDFTEILGWPLNTVLFVLLVEGMLLFRSVQQMGPGWIGKCWKAYIVGIILVVLGDFAIWATSYGYLPYPWGALGWYVWLPAAGAFSLGPAYQLEAIYRARNARRPRHPRSDPHFLPQPH